MLKKIATIAGIATVLALSACALPEWESFRAPDAATLFRPLSVTDARDKPLAPVTQADLVDSEGRCAGALVAAAGSDQTGQEQSQQKMVSLQEAGVPMIPPAIALDMTECDVVKRAGLADKVEIGRGDKGERAVTLTYTHGARPGIYRFVDGRLKSMERVAEPPPPAKGKPKPKPKPAPRQPAPAPKTATR